MRYEPSHPQRQQTPLEQLETFTDALFLPDDLIEIRAIRRTGSPGIDRVVWRTWERPEDLIELYPRLTRYNERNANIYFGVNPRTERAGTKASIGCVRCIWADIDGVTPDQALSQIDGGVPAPSICVASGHGAHLYWLLNDPYEISCDEDRVLLEALLRNLYRDIGSDSTQDVTRLMRLPGFDNVKEEKVPCRLLHCECQLHYDLCAFQRWFPRRDEDVSDVVSLKGESAASAEGRGETPQMNLREFGLSCDCEDVGRIRDLVHRLDLPVKDRSRRDFAIVCQLLRLGVQPEAICQLVEGHSKFTTPGYLRTTLANAVRAVFGAASDGS